MKCKTSYEEELYEDIEEFTRERIDKASNNIKQGEEYLNYKNKEAKIFEELKNELASEQKEKLIKLLDFIYLKESYEEKNIYKYGVHDGIELGQKLNSNYTPLA